MTDCNNKPVKIGDKAVIVRTTKDADPDFSFAGRVGEIRDVRPGWEKETTIARISAGEEGNPDWSAWCYPKEFAVI